jgi:hypothetical protein
LDLLTPGKAADRMKEISFQVVDLEEALEKEHRSSSGFTWQEPLLHNFITFLLKPDPSRGGFVRKATDLYETAGLPGMVIQFSMFCF